MGWTTRTIGGGLRVRSWEAGDGAPLLYLHGFDAHPGDAPFLAMLAESRRVIAPEHPGYGESGGADEVDDILDVVLHYRQLIEGLGSGAVDVVGHSLGGMFAAELAAICPQVVNRLVLVAPFGLWLDDNQLPDPFTMNEGALAKATWADPSLRVSAPSAAEESNGAGGRSPAIQSALLRATNLSMAGKFLWPIPDRGLAKRLMLIRAPALVVTGEQDQLIPPAYGPAFASAISGARLESVPAAGHYPMLEQPDVFVRLVSSFVS